MNQYLNNISWNGNDDDNERIDWGTSSFTAPIKQKKTFTFTLSHFWLKSIFTVVGIVMIMLLKDWLRNELIHCSNQTEANFHFQTFMFTLSRFWLNSILTVVGNVMIMILKGLIDCSYRWKAKTFSIFNFALLIKTRSCCIYTVGTKGKIIMKRLNQGRSHSLFRSCRVTL